MEECEGTWPSPNGGRMKCANEWSRIVAGMHLCEDHYDIFWEHFRPQNG